MNPFKHQDALAKYSHATPEMAGEAIQGALEAKQAWARTSLQDRAAIFYRAAALLQGPYKYRMMAATILGQGKNAYQADIDCYAEVSNPLWGIIMAYRCIMLTKLYVVNRLSEDVPCAGRDLV